MIVRGRCLKILLNLPGIMVGFITSHIYQITLQYCDVYIYRNIAA